MTAALDTRPDQPTTTRAHQLERWLFSAMRAANGATQVDQCVLMAALAQCSTASNPVVAAKARDVCLNLIHRAREDSA